jgi:hypothetical protein
VADCSIVELPSKTIGFKKHDMAQNPVAEDLASLMQHSRQSVRNVSWIRLGAQSGLRNSQFGNIAYVTE